MPASQILEFTLEAIYFLALTSNDNPWPSCMNMTNDLVTRPFDLDFVNRSEFVTLFHKFTDPKILD